MRKVIIECLLDTDDEADIADCISGVLTPQLARYTGRNNNPLLDWQYFRSNIDDMPNELGFATHVTDGSEFSEYVEETQEQSK